MGVALGSQQSKHFTIVKACSHVLIISCHRENSCLPSLQNHKYVTIGISNRVLIKMVFCLFAANDSSEEHEDRACAAFSSSYLYG